MIRNSTEADALMKSRRRVRKYGEVFTPPRIVDFMLQTDGILEGLKDPYATFLEPAAGTGNFLLGILHRKLDYAWMLHPEMDGDCASLWALSSIYGIELLEDNVLEARERMMRMYADDYESRHGRPLDPDAAVCRSAKLIIRENIRQGDFLNRVDSHGDPIISSSWNREPGPDCVHRVPFSYADLPKPARKRKRGSHADSAGLQAGDRHSVQPPRLAKTYRIVPIVSVYRQLES